MVVTAAKAADLEELVEMVVEAGVEMGLEEDCIKVVSYVSKQGKL